MSMAWQLSMNKKSKVEIWDIKDYQQTWSYCHQTFTCIRQDIIIPLITILLWAFLDIVVTGAFTISFISVQMDWQNLKLNKNYTISVSSALVFSPATSVVLLAIWFSCKFLSIQSQKKKRRGKNHSENILPKWSEIKIFCSKDIAYFYFSFFLHSNTFHDPVIEKFMTLHLWLS